MSARPQIAPAGKLTARQVHAIRSAGAARGSDYGISQRQVQRVLAGEAWASGWAPPRAPVEGEQRECPVCRTTFGRRFNNGRLRGDRLWARKLTCSNRCAVTRRHALNRAKRRDAAN